MKKNYFMLAAATMMFAACAETELVNENAVEGTPQAIGFETFANKATRAENSSAGYTNGVMSQHHDKFAVWAYKNTSDALVFKNTEITSSDYSYSPTRYWDKTATKYEFYAAAPKETTPAWEFVENTTNKDKAYFKLTDATLAATNFVTIPSTNLITTFKGLSGDVDWMIADKCPVINTNFAETTYKVQLNFIHILSRLNIIVKKSQTAPTITLNSVIVKGLNLKGSFNENEAEADGTGKINRWELANPAVTTSDYKYATNYALTSNNDYILQSLVIPQEVKYQSVKTDGSNLGTSPEAYLEIVYTINEEIFKAYYNLAAVFGSSSANVPFNEGYQNTLTITIAPEAINFTSNVALWVNDTEKEKNIN